MSISKNWIIYHPMETYIMDEMSKFKNQHDTASFLDTLNGKEKITLMKWLSHWRKNMVYERIIKTTHYEIKYNVPSYRIIIGAINDYVSELICMCDHNLSNIAESKEISEHPEFKSQGNINRKLFLARKCEGKYKIIDGSHRAIRLACDGIDRFNLLVIKPIMTTFWQRLKIHFHNLTNWIKICPKCGSEMIRYPISNNIKCIDCDMDW